MKTSRTKFVIVFVVSAFVFVFATRFLLNQPAEWVAAPENQSAWQSVISTILTPVRFILMRPLMPFINFLRQEPDTPPPFFMIGFAMYWTLLGLLVYYIIGKIKSAKLKAA
ncbi:MAG: hypothetical protein V4619_09010 [Bacteroidota bacterium]